MNDVNPTYIYIYTYIYVYALNIFILHNYTTSYDEIRNYEIHIHAGTLNLANDRVILINSYQKKGYKY